MNRATDRPPLVVLLCGLAGAGKTTYALELQADGFVRLSIDEQLWRRSGRYGLDYRPERYAELSALAETEVRAQLTEHVERGHRVVVDSSLWSRSRREEYKALVTSAGGRWRLVYLEQSPDVLRARLRDRADRFDANAAFPITDALLDDYLAEFEPPHGEGEEAFSPSTA